MVIKTKYIRYDHNGTGVRHHHYSEQNTVHEFPDQVVNNNDTGNRLASAPKKYAFDDGQDLNFAFMSVNGTKDGNLYYTTAGDYYYNVGTQNIDILAVYAPAGGIGGRDGGPGIWVDAFNVDAGDFSDDIHFISVLMPPDNILDVAKTNEANQEGDVSTETPEHIKASGTIDGTAHFLEWKQIMPDQKNEKSPDIDLAQNESEEIWIAFYQTPPSKPPKINLDIVSLFHKVSDATMRDGNTKIPIWSELESFGAALAFAVNTNLFSTEIREGIRQSTAKQIMISAEGISKKILESGVTE